MSFRVLFSMSCKRLTALLSSVSYSGSKRCVAYHPSDCWIVYACCCSVTAWWYRGSPRTRDTSSCKTEWHEQRPEPMSGIPLREHFLPRSTYGVWCLKISQCFQLTYVDFEKVFRFLEGRPIHDNYNWIEVIQVQRHPTSKYWGQTVEEGGCLQRHLTRCAKWTSGLISSTLLCLNENLKSCCGASIYRKSRLLPSKPGLLASQDGRLLETGSWDCMDPILSIQFCQTS